MKGNCTVAGQTIAEKIFTKKAGKIVTPGEIVEVEADLVVFVDLGWHMFRKGWDQLVGPKVKYPDRVAVVFDHKVPADTAVTAELHQKWRAFCKEQGITIHIVTGPGYGGYDNLEAEVAADKGVYLTHASGVISSIMKQTQLAITSNGRTVSERPETDSGRRVSICVHFE